MKILLITDNYSPTGGAEKYFFDLKKRLEDQANLQIYTLGFDKKPASGKRFWVLKASQSKVATLLSRIIFNPFLFIKLRNIIKKISPDVIHLHNVKQHSYTLLQAISGYHIVQTMHDFSFICPTAQNIHRDLTPCPTGLKPACFWQHQVKYSRLIYLTQTLAFYILRRKIKKTVSHFIAPSPILADYLTRNHFESVSVIPPFIEKKLEFLPLKNFQQFLYVGQLNTHKGVNLLIDEFAKAVVTCPTLTLKLAGSGPLYHPLQAKIKALNLEKNVEFLGWQADLTAHYAACTALIFPSIGMESFGLVITEAMSFSRPVIAINQGSAAWLVENGATGLLFNSAEAGDLSNKIMQLANNHALANKLSKQAFFSVKQKFNNALLLQKILQLYSSFLTVLA